MGTIGAPIWPILLISAIAVAAISSASTCDRCVHRTKVSYFLSDNPIINRFGACGYGSSATGFNGSHVAAASPSILQNGSKCGACYQARCTGHDVCSPEGTTFIVIDQNNDGITDFKLSQSAFVSMANSMGSVQVLLKRKKVTVEYKRIPCYYATNLTMRVYESSYNPWYLSVIILNQGGQTDVRSVDVALVGTNTWVAMKIDFGVVWGTKKAPAGPLKFRFGVTAGSSVKTYYGRNVLRATWAVGDIYDTGLQIANIVQESCWPCDNSTWGSGSVH